jgi:hypothetical protein
MTGDFTPDLMALLSADIIISTPEKWDGISRSWHSRSYVMKVQTFPSHISYFCGLYRKLYSLELLDITDKITVLLIGGPHDIG